jgi:hypothetical protein
MGISGGNALRAAWNGGLRLGLLKTPFPCGSQGCRPSQLCSLEWVNPIPDQRG